jgi:hypothetical protein
MTTPTSNAGTKRMRTFQIECGQHKGVVKARDEFSAWRKVVGDACDGFSKLARFRERLPASKNREHKAGWQVWFYVEPRYLDMRGK